MDMSSTSHLTSVNVSPDVTREKMEGMLLYRNAALMIRGLKEFTRPAYKMISKSFVSADLAIDCTDRSYMITGASSGIGTAVAIQIAKKGGTIHMVCRDRERGLQAVELVKLQSENKRVHLHIVDMSRPTSIVSFTKQFIQLGYQLNVLINVAGCLMHDKQRTLDNIDIHFATNTLGTYIMTVELIPVLQEVDDARVVTVSSGGMLVSRLDVDINFNYLRPYDGSLAYAQTKRQLVVMVEHLTRQYPGIHFSSMHPGWVNTLGLQRSMSDFYDKMKNSLRSPEEGADTIVWLAISHAPKKHAGGQFFQDRKVVPKHLPMLYTRANTQDEKELMKILLSLHHKFKLQEDQQNTPISAPQV